MLVNKWKYFFKPNCNYLSWQRRDWY